MAEAVDYSWARPGGAALKAAGKEAVGRYLYPGAGKGLGVSELADLINHGLSVWFIYEGTGSDATNYANGVNDARIAEAQAAALGHAGAVIYFACDWDVTAAQEGGVEAYFQGVNAVISKEKSGVYGSFAIVEDLFSKGLISFGYQTYAWSGGKVSSHANIYQYLNGQVINGGSVDFDRTLTAQFGQVNGSPAASGTPASGGDSLGSVTVNVAVKDIQARLNVYGYKLVVDGIFGPATTAAVKAFQKGKTLTADGIVGPLTWAALEKTPGSEAPPKSKAGLTVDGVWGVLTTKALQDALKVTADGIIGPNTIKALQHHLGVTADGINGIQTHEALQKHLNVHVDGIWGPSTTTALQSRLNEGTF